MLSCYKFQGLDFIVDGGVRIADPSTVVDMTGSYPTIIRQGKVYILMNEKGDHNT